MTSFFQPDQSLVGSYNPNNTGGDYFQHAKPQKVIIRQATMENETLDTQNGAVTNTKIVLTLADESGHDATVYLDTHYRKSGSENKQITALLNEFVVLLGAKTLTAQQAPIVKYNSNGEQIQEIGNVIVEMQGREIGVVTANQPYWSPKKSKIAYSTIIFGLFDPISYQSASNKLHGLPPDPVYLEQLVANAEAFTQQANEKAQQGKTDHETAIANQLSTHPQAGANPFANPNPAPQGFEQGYGQPAVNSQPAPQGFGNIGGFDDVPQL